MFMRCVAVVLVAAGCAWGLAGCKKGPKADDTYKQNAQAVVTALDVVKADFEKKSPMQVTAKDYEAAQAARKTWDAACTAEQKELESYKALYYALVAYGNAVKAGGRVDAHSPDPIGPGTKALDAAKKFLAEGK